MSGKLPDFDLEKGFWNRGILKVCGVDEVGRGAFAGPVFCGCVVFDPKITNTLEVLVNDSKKLTSVQRETASNWIKKNSVAWGVGMSSVSEINSCGIVGATNKAFRRAIKIVSQNMNSALDHLISDAFFIPNVVGIPKNAQTPVIRGDSKSFSVASASIVAKVERDLFMKRLGNIPEFSIYAWCKNKGYGTKEHREAIKSHGKSVHHRNKYVDTWIANIQKSGA